MIFIKNDNAQEKFGIKNYFPWISQHSFYEQVFAMFFDQKNAKSRKQKHNSFTATPAKFS